MAYRPATPPAPPGLFLGACPIARLLLGDVWGTRRGTGWVGDRGVCDPVHATTMMIVMFPGGGTPTKRGRFVSASFRCIWVSVFFQVPRRRGATPCRVLDLSCVPSSPSCLGLVWWVRVC